MTGREYVVRFSLRQRIEHFAVMILFAVLALTGFPQKFYAASWAVRLTGMFGGVASMRFIHRGAGLMLGALTVLHFSLVLRDLVLRRAAPAMIPTRRDFRDVVRMLRYYLRLSDTPARFDRFDYREKFEYWGLVFGNVIMVATGLVLLFPIRVATWLPGELIPAAKIAHSSEGLMAFLVVITWHIYNAHLAPGIFPFNRSIFTGTISKEHLRKDHPLEYERLFPAEAKEDGAVDPEKDA
jgi:formate dehydrogenase subunit gamma